MVSNIKLDSNFEYINRNRYFYGLLNILNISLLSNFGIKTKMNINFIEESLKSITTKMGINYKEGIKSEDLKWLKNISPILGVYSSDNDKTITLKNQALLIISELSLAECLFDNYILDEYKFEKELLGMILIDLAISQVNYTILSFKTEDGFLLNNKEATISSFEELGFLFYALSKLHKVIIKSGYSSQFNYDSNIEDIRIFILEYFALNEDNIILLETNKLTELVSCISKGCVSSDLPTGNYLSPSIGEELISRCLDKGYVCNKKENYEISSLTTHFRVINSLIDTFRCCNLDIFFEKALEIYQNVDNLWDNEVDLFVIKNKDVVKYSSKNIGSIFSALVKISSLLDLQSEKDKILEQSNRFLHKTLDLIGLQILPKNLNISLDSLDNISLKSFSSLFDKDSIAYTHKGFKMYYSDEDVELDKKNIFEYTLFLSNSLIEN